MGQPEQDDRCMEDLMRELSAGDGKSNPFRLFARRAQLVITGLMHISILLLPKPQEEALPSHKSAPGHGNSGGKSGGVGGGSGAGGNNSTGARGGAGAAPPHATLAEMQACGAFPADSSDLEHWDRVQQLLEQTSTSRLDWTNCCVYGLSETQGATVQPVPSYPLSCTSGYYAAQTKGDVLISNDFENKGPHFADWRALYAAGARSMAAAPMYVQQKIVGVLNLASRDPHAFDRSRLVWLMAVVLSPFVSALEFTTQHLEMDGFIKRIMPPLLEQNYLRSTTLKRPAEAGAAAGGSAGAGGGEGGSAGKGGGGSGSGGSGGGGNGAQAGLLARLFGGGGGGGEGREEGGALGGGGPPPASEDGISPSDSASSGACGSLSYATSADKVAAAALTGGRVPLGQPPRSPAGSDQFAHNAEVLITAGMPGGGAVSAPLAGGYLPLPAASPEAQSQGASSSASKPASSACSAGSAAASSGGAGAAAGAGGAWGGSQAGSGRGSGRAGRTNGRRGAAAGGESGAGKGGATGNGSEAALGFGAGAGGEGEGAKAGAVVPKATPAAAPHPTTTPAAVSSAPHPTTTPAGPAPAGYDALEPYLSSYDSDLDWGDFFFNLISMCIVYAYFSEAAVAGESQAAIVVSMCIAAIDIVLLALRWLWYEQYITYGGAVLQVFQMYRLVVLPVANTWMSWSLLNKLGITPGAAVVAGVGALVVLFLVLGVQMRFFLHAPLQLASVLFAASSTTDVCSRFLSSTTGLGCMSLVSLLQLSVGVVIPSLMVHVLDMRATDKAYLPHVQAKRWLLHP